ncbi:MAG: hypothetical protein KH828_09940 [Clostridiales bacterium]|nr:hypothetical protein [Clostridiales bacterium]
MQKKDYLKLDTPGSISFEGSKTAELFTKEIQESLKGLLSKNYFYAEDENLGFINSSVDGRPWTGTMWSRDAGTILRELVCWGYTGSAFMTARQLIRLCAQNPEGFFTFPERFEPGRPDYGTEVDGTASILVAFAMLAKRLKLTGTTFSLQLLDELLEFVCSPKSPLSFLIEETKKKTLLAGSGEFGGGLFVDGDYCNVVQNMLAVYALYNWETAFETLHNDDWAKKCRKAAETLEGNVRKYLVDKDLFIWCIDQETLLPPTDILQANANVGFTGINGVGAMVSDVLTQEEIQKWWGRDAAVNTFYQLLKSPQRKEQYEKYGMYLQFEQFCEGMLTSPSYGQGYAIQLALSMGLQKEASVMLAYLAEHTNHPHKNYELHRDSEYWFYERLLSPDYFSLPQERQTIEEGCGALNVVNVAEPLKIARMIAGVNNPASETPAPIFIEGIHRVKISNWMISEQGTPVYKDFEMEVS